MESKCVWKCKICGAEMPDYEPRFCCFSYDCGCGGMPIDPPVCSNECWDKLMKGNIQNEDSGTIV